MIVAPTIEVIKSRIIEVAEMDQKRLLRPLLLFRGGQSEGRMRSLFNLATTLMDSDVPSVTEAIKVARAGDWGHACGFHGTPVNGVFNSIFNRLIAQRRVADLVPGLWEYSRHMAGSSGACYMKLDPIAEFALRVRSTRDWRLMPPEMRPHRERKAQRPKLAPIPELYPYISGTPTDEHELILAVDAVVPRGLPNATRCDLCQDMLVAVLSGETTVEGLRGDMKKYLSAFWKMFPDKYGHISLDANIPGTNGFTYGDKLSSRGVRL